MPRLGGDQLLSGWGRVHVCHVIHALGAGGAEQVLVDLGRAAADVPDLELSVLSLVDVPDPVHADDLRRAGVVVRHAGVRSRWDPRALVRAGRAVRDLRPDLLHTHLKHADLVGAVLSLREGVPLVSTLHVIEQQVGPLGAGKRWLAGQARQAVAARTVAVSEAQRRWYLSTFRADPSKVVTVHNGVFAASALDEGERVALRRGLGAGDGEMLTVNVALMRPGKGHEDLLRAAALFPEDAQVRVVLVGDGPERSRLERAVGADPRLAGRVGFAGYRTDVAALWQAADLAVHASHAEALPTALIHALGAGTPVVAADVGGVAEVVGDDAGLLVPVGDPQSLAAGVMELVRSPERRSRMGRAGRARFAEEFDARVWVRRLRDLYAEVLRERG